VKLTLVDERNQPYRAPYLVRLGGWTLERYLTEAPEYPFWEFVREEVVMYSPATAEHQDLVGFFYRLIGGYCEARGWGKVLMGPAALKISPDVVREPDLFVLPPEEVPKAKGVPLEVRPALVIEVLSPATRTVDLKEKPEDYALAGIPEYWAVDPEEKRVVVHRLLSAPKHAPAYAVQRMTSGRLEAPTVPGFWLLVEWLWQEPLPPVAGCLEAVLGRGEKKA